MLQTEVGFKELDNIALLELTLTFTKKLVPLQPSVIGVTSYFANPILIFELEFIRVWEIVSTYKALAWPPKIPVVMVGASHEYFVPIGELLGTVMKVPPLQMVVLMSGNAAFGVTVITTLKGLPWQPPVLGVTLYEAVATAFVLLIKFWLIFVTDESCLLPPDNALAGLITGLFHV